MIQEMLQPMVDSMGLAGTIDTIVRQEVSKMNLPHHPLPLTIALQFWDGDAEEALSLVRLIADAEPEFRDDVVFFLAHSGNDGDYIALKSMLEIIKETFPVVAMQFPLVIKNSHPDGCYYLWSKVVGHVAHCRIIGEADSSQNIFTIEPDGCPTRIDWIDEIKRQHAYNLSVGKRVTGHLSSKVPTHVNGSLVMHASCWTDHPSLHSCPSGEPWDVFHGQVLSSERGPLSPIVNLYGAKDITEGVFHALAREYAWVSSVKDDSAKKCFQGLIDRRKESEGQK